MRLADTVGPRLVMALVLGMAVGLTSCGGPGGSGGEGAEGGDAAGGAESTAASVVASEGAPDGLVAAVAPGDEGAAPAADAERAGSARTPTSEWTDRRAVEAADEAFPHSAHRELDCQRCHGRPSTHLTHAGAECTACHARPRAFADMQTLASAECAACHHRNATNRDCGSCHQRAELGPRPVLASVATASGARVRVRRLTFAHERHSALSCTGCHAEPVTRSFGEDCSLCHTAHHRPEATCISCHDAGQVDAHQNVVHAGCAGGGCHEAATVTRFQPTRNVCLVCHTAQVDHEAGQECRSCHVGLLDAPGARPGPGARGTASSPSEAP